MSGPGRRTMLWLLVAAVVLGGSAWTAWSQRVPLEGLFGPEAPKPVLGLEGVECLGRVEVEGGLLELAPVRAGEVAEVPVREGEMVEAGAVLLRLDEEPGRLQVRQAEAALEAARARVALAEEAVRLHPVRVAGQELLATAARSRASAARQGWQRQERLYAQDLVGKEERAGARDEASALEALAGAEQSRLGGLRGEDPSLRVRQARAEQARAEALVAEARHGLKQCLLTAPVAGRVLRLRAGVGEIGSPQAPAVVLAPERPRRVRAEVEQEMVHLVKVGQEATVRDEMNPEWSWPGRVARVGEWYADTPQIPKRTARFTDIPTVECVIELDPGYPPLRIGQRMTVLLGKAR